MSTLAQDLPGIIQRAEAKHGSDNPFVQQLKKQLADCQARDPNKKPSEVTYYTGAGPQQETREQAQESPQSQSPASLPKEGGTRASTRAAIRKMRVNFLVPAEENMAITTADLNQRIREENLGLPLAPERDQFETEDAFLAAKESWDHRVAKSLLPTMNLWKATRAKLESQDPSASQ